MSSQMHQVLNRELLCQRLLAPIQGKQFRELPEMAHQDWLARCLAILQVRAKVSSREQAVYREQE